MTDPFAIEALSTSVTVEEGSAGELEVDVTNMLDRHVRVGLEVRGERPLERSWVHLEPSTFHLTVNESRKVALTVSPPAGAEPGESRFRLRAYDVDQPADVFTEGPPISVSLRAPAPEPRRPSKGLLAAVLGWFAGSLAGLLAGSVLGLRLFAPARGGDFETFGEALGAALGEAIAAAIAAVLLALLLGWVLSALAVWLALRLRGHSRRVLTAGLSFGLGVPWIIAVVFAGRLGDVAAVLGWLAFLLLLAANPALLSRLLVLRVFEPRTPAAPEPAPPEPAPPA